MRKNVEAKDSNSLESVIDADQAAPHEESQNPVSVIITYGDELPPGEEYHDVVVDGKRYKSLFTQKNLDFADRDSITREEYESAFLNLVSCIEGRGGWIHYDLEVDRVNYTYTTAADPHDYCYTSHFQWADSVRSRTHYSDESERLWFYINCLKDNGVVPVHAEPAEEFGPSQWDQNHELQVQVRDEGVECGDYIDSFYDDAPYPE